jgi:sporulation integral membrane protein YtvI
MDYLNIIKKILIGIFICFLVYAACKLTVFYIPFLVAYIISIILDPLIKFVNKRTGLSRKTSSIIVLFTIFSIIIILLIWGSINLISETTNLLSGLNTYLEKTIILIKSLGSKIKIDDFKFSEDVISIFQNTTTDYLNMITKYLKDLLTKIIDYITSIPSMLVNIVITILATYFITSDKFYILDRMEHHLSKKMMGKVMKYAKSITSSLGGYLKAEVTLSLITFLVVLTGLNIFYLIGMEVEYPILMAIFIGFVDVLPILGAGSIMVPWSIILFLNNQVSLAFSVLGLFVLTVVLKQFIEPKLVSKNISIHPIFTLLAMYTGFKIMGVIGLLVGPIILIIFKNIFSEVLDKGILNSIVDN